MSNTHTHTRKIQHLYEDRIQFMSFRSNEAPKDEALKSMAEAKSLFKALIMYVSGNVILYTLSRFVKYRNSWQSIRG